MGGGLGWFDPRASPPSTTLMVPQDQLTRVAGMNATLQGIIRFAAPPLGALLLAVVDVPLPRGL